MVKFHTMDKWAVIKTGGKQYKVSVGDTIEVEKLAAEGEKVSFDEVLITSEGDKIEIGLPVVAKAKVTAKLLGNFRDKKVRIVKFKSKSKYTRTKGHRQDKSRVLIESIAI